MNTVKRIHIIGRKNSGKTSLVVELVQALTERGLRVGTVKHTHHQHQLDTPGKDSFRHGEAGAAVVGILTPGVDAVFCKTNGQDESVDRYCRLAGLFADCDLVLVEGDSQADAPKIEVWRAAIDELPLAGDDRSISAIVSDDAVQANCATWPRADVHALATKILEMLDESVVAKP